MLHKTLPQQPNSRLLLLLLGIEDEAKKL